jgi:hypothetical protein
MAADIDPKLSLEARIRERAYEIYLSRNSEGDELSDWLTAEQELKASNDQQNEVSNAEQAQDPKGSSVSGKKKRSATASL